MPISINPTLPVIALQGAAPELTLQPGTVVDAQVLKVLSADLVRIAIANLAIDALTEVPLQVGQALQLTVSQTPSGVRLSLAPPAGDATAAEASAGRAPDAASPAGQAPSAGMRATATGGPGLATPLTISGVGSVNTVVADDPLTPAERLAVSAATENAVTRQDGMAQLFANLGTVATTGRLPPALQQAVATVLARQTDLGPDLTADDIRDAVRQSGIFLEASLASESTPVPTGNAPDLKAALIVLRQTLTSTLARAADLSPSPSVVSAAPSASYAAPADRAAASAAAGQMVSSGIIDDMASPALVPPAVPASEGPVIAEILPPLIRAILNEPQSLAGSTGGRGADGAVANAAPRIAGGAVSLLQELAQGGGPESAVRATFTMADPRDEGVVIRTNMPPPPFRGAQPTPQPIAMPRLAPDAPVEKVARQLLDDTDAAIARQTLMQVASLPDRTDAASRSDPAAPRWNFEIPFATPQGTAVAQFEISRDGGGAAEVEAAKRVWRARFALDLEPAGPIQVLVTLNDERTSVRLWAERPATAARLRAGAAELGQALSRAELQPGEIVVREGVPAPVRSAPSGYFLDRAL